VAVISLLDYASEEMIERFSLAVPCSYMKEIFFLMMNLLQQMVRLRVMEGFVALIRILGMMKLRNCLMLHGMKLEQE
jgi:hypothetical protein